MGRRKPRGGGGTQLSMSPCRPAREFEEEKCMTKINKETHLMSASSTIRVIHCGVGGRAGWPIGLIAAMKGDPEPGFVSVGLVDTDKPAIDPRPSGQQQMDAAMVRTVHTETSTAA